MDTLGKKCISLSGAFLLVSIGTLGTQSIEAQDRFDGIIENATYYRDSRGLSKFRNLIQLEFEKNVQSDIFSKVSLYGVFRGSYDGVYDLNDDEFGDSAGRAIMLQNVAAGPEGFVPHGGGLDLPFTFDINNHPNQGLIVLGEELHDANGGVTFAVPVRPCDVDNRGCIDGYMDKTEDELRYQEFNSKLDFVRELYLDLDYRRANGDVISTRIGRQQVIWGRTDLFRVLDVLNPVDFSRNNIYDELEDIRIPMWMLTTEYRFGATRMFDDLNVQLVWNFDEFRPSDLGQCGQPNAILDAGCFFRGMKTLWDFGGTVSNFAGGVVTTDFGPGQIGIRKANMPDWSLDNTQIGVKVEGVYKDWAFSLNFLEYRSHLPSLRGGIEAQNSFTGEVGTWPGLIAFDIHFPRLTLIGGSADYFFQPIDTAFRIELAHTMGEEFANTMRPRLFSENDVTRFVIGADKTFFIPWLNRTRAFLFSGQLFGQHIHDHERESRLLGTVGIPDKKTNFIGTALFQGWWMSDRLSPQLITAYDFGAKAAAIAPSVLWLISDNWDVRGTLNVKVGHGARNFDDCRSCNPFAPFTSAFPEHPQGFSLGLSGFEPLGRFKAGPIGMAMEEDEFQFTLRYKW